MGRNLLLKDKGGVDLMVGYVLLIVIALALAAGVFFYLKLYLPSDKPACSSDVDISIDEVVCVISSNTLPQDIYINITNRGLFSIDSAFIKIGEIDRVFKSTLKDPSVQTNWFDTDPNKCPVGPSGNGLELRPGEKFCGDYDFPASGIPTIGAEQEISVEPFMYLNNKPVICTEAVVKKTVTCV